MLEELLLLWIRCINSLGNNNSSDINAAKLQSWTLIILRAKSKTSRPPLIRFCPAKCQSDVCKQGHDFSFVFEGNHIWVSLIKSLCSAINGWEINCVGAAWSSSFIESLQGRWKNFESKCRKYHKIHNYEFFRLSPGSETCPEAAGSTTCHYDANATTTVHKTHNATGRLGDEETLWAGLPEFMLQLLHFPFFYIKSVKDLMCVCWLRQWVSRLLFAGYLVLVCAKVG